jgi:hypothetical protein
MLQALAFDHTFKLSWVDDALRDRIRCSWLPSTAHPSISGEFALADSAEGMPEGVGSQYGCSVVSSYVKLLATI